MDAHQRVRSKNVIAAEEPRAEEIVVESGDKDKDTSNTTKRSAVSLGIHIFL